MRWSLISRIVLALLFLAAGINHFLNPAPYLQIMPPWIPYPEELVALSGMLEIVGAVMLVLRTTCKWGAWLLVVLLVAVFPANIQMALNWYRQGHPLLWIALLRLPLQGVLIWWAYSFTRPERGK